MKSELLKSPARIRMKYRNINRSHA